MVFEDCARKATLNDSFYKHKKQWDEFTKLKKKVGHQDGVTNTLGKTTIDKYRLNKIFVTKHMDTEGEMRTERDRIIKEEEQAQRQYEKQIDNKK